MRIEDSEIDNFLLRDGDVLICEGGHGIGRSAVWRGREGDFVFQKALHRVRPGQFLNSDFIAHCAFVYFHAGILDKYYTGVGIPHFTGVALSKLVFPLPPLAEQGRIVAKAKELMSVCDRLESQLTTAQTENRHLLEAVLYEAIAQGSGAEIGDKRNR
jgi:type I restriction enzyme S subunit